VTRRGALENVSSIKSYHSDKIGRVKYHNLPSGAVSAKLGLGITVSGLEFEIS